MLFRSEAVAGDIQIQATKIGMLATAAIALAVAAAIEELDLPIVVLDPVMLSSSGERLLDADGVQALSIELLSRAAVVTPNIPEAEILSGCRIVSSDDRRRAAERIHEKGAAAVVITGGHAIGPGNNVSNVDSIDIVDLLFDGTSFHELRTPRVEIHGAHRTHGTGCAYASALAAGLALGHPLAESAARAQQYVAGAIANAVAIGRGALVLDHFWQTRSSPGP